jgi:ATP-dependent Clp protease ATP-binding subunit ClpC
LSDKDCQEAEMYERFSDPARRAMNQVYEVAQGRNHPYIGTEHLLLAIAGERAGIASAVLTSLKIEIQGIREVVGRFVQQGSEPTTRAFWFFRPKMPYAPTAKQVIELAMQEVRDRGSSYVGTEHLLLGLLRVPTAVSAHVLKHVGTSYDQLSALIAERHGAGESEASASKM